MRRCRDELAKLDRTAASTAGGAQAPSDDAGFARGAGLAIVSRTLRPSVAAKLRLMRAPIKVIL